MRNLKQSTKQNIKQDLKNAFIMGMIITFLFATHKAAADYIELNTVQKDISESIVRLHIISNDESGHAEEEKMKIKREVLEILEPLLKDIEERDEAYAILKENLYLFETLSPNGNNGNIESSNINASIEQRRFPFIRYSNFRLPKGYYTALVLEIGEAQGSNWWCVLFPTMCFLESNGKLENEYLEEYEIIFRIRLWDILWQ